MLKRRNLHCDSVPELTLLVSSQEACQHIGDTFFASVLFTLCVVSLQWKKWISLPLQNGGGDRGSAMDFTLCSIDNGITPSFHRFAIFQYRVIFK